MKTCNYNSIRIRMNVEKKLTDFLTNTFIYASYRRKGLMLECNAQIGNQLLMLTYIFKHIVLII